MPFRPVGHNEVISPTLVTAGSDMRNESCIEYAFDISVLRSKYYAEYGKEMFLFSITIP